MPTTTETTWRKLQPLDGRPNPCACCPPIPARAPMTKGIAVGFGDAYVSCDGDEVLNGERLWRQTGSCPTFADAEKLAARNPDHDWRVVLYGPLHGEQYQRHGAGEWMLVEKNEGFA